MKKQEVFNTVLRHLAKMTDQAVDGAACCYRTPEGNSCAVGCLINDDEYNPDMEGSGVAGLGLMLPERLRGCVGLLKALQMIHDDPRNWERDEFGQRVRMERELVLVAAAAELDASVLYDVSW